MKPRRRSIQKIEKKKKRKPRQAIQGQDPQQPSRGADPFKHKGKGRLGQLEGKRQKKKIRNKKQKSTSASRTQRPLMVQTEENLEEPEQGSTKKRIITSGFQVGRTRFCLDGKEKGKVETAKETGMPRRAYLSTSQRR